MGAQSFYESLPSFRDFREITVDAHFVNAPADWSVVITDVHGSTRAIEQGRYKDVNMIGAASISVARRAMAGRDFPYAFGGDGATLLISPDDKDSVLSELCGLRELAKESFGLELRVGHVEIAELLPLGLNVGVAKYEVANGRCLAVLRGEGLKEAERRVKHASGAHEVNVAVLHPASLDGLSCRWQPIASRRGSILSILVLSRIADTQNYTALLAKLDEIFADGLEASNPVNVDLMRYRTFRECLRQELKCHKSIFSVSFLRGFIDIVGAVLVYTYGIPPGFFDPKHYAASLPRHSDFRKFDDMLKMTVDCSKEEAGRVRAFLQERHAAGEIYYGLFETGQSLMTCYVDSLNDGDHIHFIDADNGGYAVAASCLKQQIKEAGAGA